MTTHYMPPVRVEGFFRGIDGRLTTSKYEDDSKSYTLDFTDALNGATISSVTWTLDGPTSQAQSNTTTSVTIRLTKSGTGELKIVTSASETLYEHFRWESIDDGADDYA